MLKNENPNLMENAIRGVTNQMELYMDALEYDDFELAVEHLMAAALLEGLSQDYIPCLKGEL